MKALKKKYQIKKDTPVRMQMTSSAERKKEIRKDVTVLIRAGKSSAIPGRIGRNRRVVALRRMSGNIAGRRLWGFYIRAHIYGDPRTAKPSPFN